MNFFAKMPFSSFLTSPDSTRRKTFCSSHVALFAAVALISVLPYLWSLTFGFVYDDDVQILENPLLGSQHLLHQIFSRQSWSFLYPNASGGYYRPVFLLWLSAN